MFASSGLSEARCQSVTDGSASNHVVIRATGKLSKDELARFRMDLERMVQDRGKLRVLFDATECEASEMDSATQWLLGR